MSLVQGDLTQAVSTPDGLIMVTRIIEGIPGVVTMLDCRGESPLVLEELFDETNHSCADLIQLTVRRAFLG